MEILPVDVSGEADLALLPQDLRCLQQEVEFLLQLLASCISRFDGRALSPCMGHRLKDKGASKVTWYLSDPTWTSSPSPPGRSCESPKSQSFGVLPSSSTLWGFRSQWAIGVSAVCSACQEIRSSALYIFCAIALRSLTVCMLAKQA